MLLKELHQLAEEFGKSEKRLRQIAHDAVGHCHSKDIPCNEEAIRDYVKSRYSADDINGEDLSKIVELASDVIANL